MKSIIILFLAFALGLECFAQSYKPCAAIDLNRDLEGMRRILKQDVILGTAYVKIISEIIGTNVSYSPEEIDNIVDHSVVIDESFVNPSDYENGARLGNKIVFIDLLGRPSKNWVALYFNNTQYPYAKLECLNPQRKKIRDILPPQAQEKPIQIPQETTTIDCNCPQRQQQQNSGVTIVPSGVGFITDEPYYQRGDGFYGGVSYSSNYYQPSYPQNVGVSYYSSGNSSAQYNQPQSVYRNNSGSPHGASGNHPSRSQSGSNRR